MAEPKEKAFRNPGRPAVKRDVPPGDEQVARKIAAAKAAKAKGAKG